MEQSNNPDSAEQVTETNSLNEDSQLIVAREILPEVLHIIPISHRPIFPGMMIPIVLTGDFMVETANHILESRALGARFKSMKELKNVGVILKRAQPFIEIDSRQTRLRNFTTN